MVTSRRQIVRDEDRYGGFADTETYDREIDEREISDDILKMRSYVAEPAKAAPVPEKPESAPARKPATERTETAVPPARDYEKKTVVAPAPARKNIRDVMPEIVRPRREVREASAEPTPVIREKKLTAATKKALVIYMAVVLAIVAGIIATGVVVSGVAAEVTGFETAISQQQETIVGQRETLAAIDAGLKEEAEKLGLVEIDENEIKGYEKLEIGGNTEDASGIFDDIRDWFNSVFGG